ncbi:MAG: BMP family ABC transporter substrate-binding protein [Bifidobacteriaceae bacterium]|jgi:basic membrane protein A|nr:BMP family ABC transporter substrate-binding protein [Bifidobacteriaceae bacterium]
MRKRIYSAVAVAAVSALALGACGTPDDSGSEETTSGPPTTAAAEDTAEPDFQACMVSDEGGFDDKSFNQSTYEGLEKAKTDLGIATQALESNDPSDFAQNLDQLVSSNCNLIITVGFNLSDATKAAAEANPDINYAIVDDSQISAPNVKSVVYATQEAAFLAGYAAASYSKTGSVGTFGGMQIPTVTIFMDGFADGVAQYNQAKGKDVKVIGWDKGQQDGLFTGDFSDVAKGKTTSETLISQGADVIMPVAGPVGAGASAAAKDKGDVAIVWVDADGYVTTEFQDIMLTSVMKLMGEAVEAIVKDAMEGKFTSDAYIGTLANGGVAMAPFHDFESQISDETKAELDDLKAKIASGELVVDSRSAP